MALSSQLNAIKWGEFKLGDLFEASNGDFDIQKRHINHKGEFVITAGLSNNGVLGQSDIKAKVFESHSITIDMFGCAFYRSFPYKMVTHARVFSLKPKFEINHKIGLFLSTLFFDYPKKFGYENMCSWAKIKNDKVILPLKPSANTQTLDGIDFHFMEKFIAELEAYLKATLEAYLKATGLSNTTLSDDEENALNLFNGKNSGGGGGNTPCSLTWQSFRLGDLFEKIIIKPLPYQTAQLPKEKTPTHELPALTAGILNQGLNNFVPKENATILKNVISISANGANTGATFYQPHEFCVLQDAYAIEFIGDKKLNDKEYLFFVCAISKVIYNNSKYEWTNKAGWNKVKNELISLPLKPTANTQTLKDIDFHFMRTFINALMKQTIQGVVQYSSAKIQATKEAISQETPTQKDSLF
ncbi:restriction endonuclease subunit S [Helicobacter pylori]|uniref:restriction endonuclease subunit S n=1 Tax=Helicobacter pylori TaxID=210 RepID=UPI00192462FB|nr:restriction endonuclease subunit S [Helicobacter pylori]QQW91392.1 restriction endonuclease subunit S [Helicobacter pylori]